ncbi:MAG TPA: hypothetical protein VGL46_21440 [Pseudonocardiaceae bacterium]|jgi:hypothetical protein
MTTTPEPEELEAALRRWAATCNANVAAAVGLLLDHDSWLHRSYFTASVVTYHPDEELATIRWVEVQKLIDQGVLGSDSEVNVLKFAVALAQDRYGWSKLGESHRHLVGRAADRALNRGSWV